MLKIRPFVTACIGVLLLCAASAARADMLDDSHPPECPEGAKADICHGGPYCSVVGCNKDTDCETGHCEQRSFCIGSIRCGGMRPSGETESPATPTVESLCEGNTCPRGGVCKQVSICVPGERDGDGPGPSAGPRGGSGARGCGCEFSAPSPWWAGVMVGVGAGMLLGRRRKRNLTGGEGESRN